MDNQPDLVIRGGSLVDGSGTDAFIADIAVTNGTITAIGEGISTGKEEISAEGLTVTPAFIDVQAHLDGNVTWESSLKPATGHGIGTAVMGNCGVGFAPCLPEHREFNIALMEGVEDIPAEQLHEGLPWAWQVFPEYLAYLRERQYDMNVAALLPHSCLRVNVMGERAINGEPATDADLDRMAGIVRDAVAAGALGLGSTRLVGQKTRSGIPAPSLGATEAEYRAIGKALGPNAVLQIAPEFNQYPLADEEMDMIIRVAAETGCKVTYSLKQTNEFPDGWRSLLEKTARANEQGLTVRPQVLARPTGAIISWEANVHPFSRAAAYREIADLPIDERFQELVNRRTEIIRQVEEQPGGFGRLYNRMFTVSDRIFYEPKAEDSVIHEAERLGCSTQQLLFDTFMQNDGRGVCMLASGNYAEFSLTPALEMLKYDHALPGLGDAGAHCTIICDASATTHLLSYWTRDRDGEKLSLPTVVRKLTSEPADFFGFTARGALKVGHNADINIIDMNALDLHAPRMVYDLPANGRRLVQDACGYIATILGGVTVTRDDTPTGNYPGRLI